MMTDVAAVVAAASGSRGIGSKGQMPWRLPGDMAHFKRVTSTPRPLLVAGNGDKATTMNAVIMGRKTWDSIPPKFRPLEGRINVVLSRAGKVDGIDASSSSSSALPSVLVASSLDEAMTLVQSRPDVGTAYVIGGGEVYKRAMESGLVNRVVYTDVEGLSAEKVDTMDAFFPELGEEEWERFPFAAEGGEVETEEKKEEEAEVHVDKKSGLKYSFWEYRRRSEGAEPPAKKAKTVEDLIASTTKPSEAVDPTSTLEPPVIEEGADVNPEEMQYLDMCREILDSGVERGDRTGTGTLSRFGTQMRFSLRDGTLPLLTTKRTFWRGVAEELLWFVKGSTNANDLAAKNIHIWDGNGSREFLDSRNLSHREQGDLGPVYGFQWRHFGADYTDMHADYTGKGVDQLADCIDKIKNNPEDRRIIMSAWNPADLDQMALPPCHMFCQFYVDTKKNELSCQMYQRSADMGLGVPFNIASYALLTHMIAKVTGRKPGDFVHTIGDAHVYLNHVDALKEQIERKPRAFPKLVFGEGKEYGDIDGFEFEDFEVVGYKPHKTIKMKMAV